MGIFERKTEKIGGKKPVTKRREMCRNTKIDN